MNNKPQNLGLNCSVFEDFITGNCIYVDKTKIIHSLITTLDRKHFYFVSRPRRFGKSLFLSTLQAIFSGKKELFSSYWIGKHGDYEWSHHPVIFIDFGAIAHGDGHIFKKDLGRVLDGIAQRYGVVLAQDDEPERKLVTLVEALHTNERVVLLIDEYDKPLIDHLDNKTLAEENRKILNSFYTTVKSLESHWRAIFITGVSKFSKTSLFSGLNNLKELSFDPRAAELFGYTYDELVVYFSAHIDGFARHLDKTREEVLDSMKIWYNGYRFSKDMKMAQMYSPLSIVACLDDKEFANYWFNTGSPGFLIALLRLKGIGLEIRDVIKIPFKLLNVIDINTIPLFALLVQTGYLTIVEYDPVTEVAILDYPNREVRESFKDYLMQAFAYVTPEVLAMELIHMQDALVNRDFATFCNAVKVVFAGIPHNLHIARESYYHSLFHLMFDMLGMRPQSEVASSRGESDLVLETVDSVIVFEFKYDKSAQEAMDQIIQKKYYEKYMHKNKAIVLVGIDINFKNKDLEFEWLERSI